MTCQYKKFVSVYVEGFDFLLSYVRQACNEVGGGVWGTVLERNLAAMFTLQLPESHVAD